MLCYVDEDYVVQLNYFLTFRLSKRFGDVEQVNILLFQYLPRCTENFGRIYKITKFKINVRMNKENSIETYLNSVT